MRAIAAGIVALSLGACAHTYDQSIRQDGNTLTTVVCVKNYGDPGEAATRAQLHANARFKMYKEAEFDPEKRILSSRGRISGVREVRVLETGDPYCVEYAVDQRGE